MICKLGAAKRTLFRVGNDTESFRNLSFLAGGRLVALLTFARRGRLFHDHARPLKSLIALLGLAIGCFPHTEVVGTNDPNILLRSQLLAIRPASKRI